MFLKEDEKRFKFVKSIDHLYEVFKRALAGTRAKKEDLVAYLTEKQDFEDMQRNGCLVKKQHEHVVIQNDFLVTGDYGRADPYRTSVLRAGLVKSEGKPYVKALREYETNCKVDPDMKYYYKMVGIEDPLDLYKEDPTENK